MATEPIELEELDVEAQTRKKKDKKPQATRTLEAQDDGYFVSSGVDARTTLASAAGNEHIIDLNNVHKTYLLGVEGVPALRGVSLTIGRGEFVCVFGTSGGGKTSLLNVIGTIDKPTKGDIKVAGTRINARTTDKELADLRLYKLGFVFQTFNLLSALTAIENVEMPMILANRLTRAERRSRAKGLLERVGMGARLDHLPSQLSGGEQQRVTIARAIANQPDVLLLDEPTGDLDTVNTSIVLRLLLELNQEGITLVMVTHDVGLKFLADRVIWMRDGKIQRVEQVTAEKQKEARTKLLAVGEAAAAASSQQKGEQGAGNAVSFSNTVVRRPRDYHTYSALDVAPAATSSTNTVLPVASP